MKFSYATTTSQRDWQAGVMDNLDVTGTGVELVTEIGTRQFNVGEGIRDIVAAPDGNLYTISSTGGVFQYNPTTGARERLLKRTDPNVSTPCALCASPNRVFVCDEDDGSITALSPDLRRVVGTLRPRLTDPTEIVYADGTIYIIDDTDLVAVARDGTPTVVCSDRLTAPIDIATHNNTLYVLDDDERAQWLYRIDTKNGVEVTSSASSAGFTTSDGLFTPTCLTMLGDTPVMAGQYTDRSEYGLFVYDTDTEEFQQRVTLPDLPQELVAEADTSGPQTLYVIIGQERRCLGFEEERAYSKHHSQDRHVGTAILRYDSGVEAIDWHRLTLDIVRSSASTQIRVHYFATDDRQPDPLSIESVAVSTLKSADVRSLWELATTETDSLPVSEIDYQTEQIQTWQQHAGSTLATVAASEWTTSGVINPEDILLDDASGRYLYVAIELLGTPNVSPLVDSVRAYCPRTSYLRHLPEMYQDDPESSAFLERFLSVMETSFVDIETTIESIGEYFDPHGAPSESLSWVEDWIGLDIGHEWPESARRELLSRAPELYRKRGTKAGLVELIRLYLRHENPSLEADDYRLFFVERTDLDSVSESVVDRQYGAFLPDGRSFAIFCDAFDSETQREAVRDIVESESPAHVNGAVVPIESEFTLGAQSFLGINSELDSRAFSLGEAALGTDTVLATRPGESVSD
jgi:phage tail-like protein